MFDAYGFHNWQFHYSGNTRIYLNPNPELYDCNGIP